VQQKGIHPQAPGRNDYPLFVHVACVQGLRLPSRRDSLMSTRARRAQTIVRLSHGPLGPSIKAPGCAVPPRVSEWWGRWKNAVQRALQWCHDLSQHQQINNDVSPDNVPQTTPTFSATFDSIFGTGVQASRGADERMTVIQPLAIEPNEPENSCSPHRTALVKRRMLLGAARAKVEGER
jgi:hypothetical protein